MLGRIVLRDASTSEWLTFTNPLFTLVARRSADVLPVLIEAERCVVEENLYAAGFVSFEAAPAFDPSFVVHTDSQLPLVCLGLYARPECSQHIDSPDRADTVPAHWKMTESRRTYMKNLATIKRQIELGNTYQINYTTRQRAGNIVDPWAMFLEIATDVPYAAYVECGDHAIVSASPELFFRLNGEELVSKPMKGTARRGMTLPDDLILGEELHSSSKNRAENVMIADMVRNDLGRIANTGSVTVRALFELEKYATVWQLTSTVAAETSAPVSEIFRALFPCASITGAPKISSLAIIAELEDTPREIYTGAIGFMAPNRQAQFNVAIRTALVNTKTHEAVYGVGGGIIWDSDPDEEYDECLTKAKVLSSSCFSGEFELLETMLWTPEEGLFLGKEHLERMGASAAYFDYQFDRNRIEDMLADVVQGLPRKKHRLRLLLQRNGKFNVTASTDSIFADTTLQPIGLAAEPVDVDNPFLYHKTTRRDVYERAVRSTGDDDVLLWNTRQEITESSIANVVIQIEDEWCTPPVESGLLAGTYRGWLIRKGEIKERKIYLDEIAAGAEILLINSVRGKYRRVLRSTQPA